MDCLLFIAILGIMMTPMGAFLIWRRWSFLGDSLAHCALLGAALGVMANVPWNWSYCILAAIVSLSLLLNLEKSEQWLAMIAYGAVPLGLLMFSFLPKIYLNPKDVLFGSYACVDRYDWGMLFVIGGVVVVVVKKYWDIWLLSAFNRDLALVEGHPVKKLESVFVLLVALLIAISMKFLGQLLAPGLIVMPCIAAGCSAKTPEDLVKKAILIVIISVVLAGFGAEKMKIDFAPLFLSVIFGIMILKRIMIKK